MYDLQEGEAEYAVFHHLGHEHVFPQRSHKTGLLRKFPWDMLPHCPILAPKHEHFHMDHNYQEGFFSFAQIGSFFSGAFFVCAGQKHKACSHLANARCAEQCFPVLNKYYQTELTHPWYTKSCGISYLPQIQTRHPLLVLQRKWQKSQVRQWKSNTALDT